MGKQKSQVILVSGFTYRDYILKSSLCDDETYGGLLDKSVEKIPPATFGSLEQREKMLKGVPEDAQAILDYQRNCGVEVKIALSYAQAFNMTSKMRKRNMPIEAFVFYRLLEDKRHNLHEILLDDQAGFGLYRACMGMRPGPIFVICSPRTDGYVKQYEPQQSIFSLPDPSPHEDIDLESKLEIVEKIKQESCYGRVYLEEQGLAIALLNNIHNDPFTYGTPENIIIRSREDFLNPEADVPEEVQTTATDIVDAVVHAPGETALPETEKEDEKYPDLAEPYTVARTRQEAAANMVMRALVAQGKKQKR